MTDDRDNPFEDTPGLREIRDSVKCKGYEVENCPNKRRYDRGIYGGLCEKCAERKKGSPLTKSSLTSKPHTRTSPVSRPGVEPEVNLEQVVAMMDLGVEMIFKVGDRKFRLQEVKVEDQV